MEWDMKRIRTIRASGVGLFAALALAAGSAAAKNVHYRQVDLVSDLPGAQLQNTNLVNAWGISFGPTTPFWVSANGTGRSQLYAVTNDSSGPHVTKQALEVAIPG